MAVAALRPHAVAASTMGQRNVAFNKWSAFCRARGLEPMRHGGMTPRNIALAEAFIAELCVTEGLQGDTAKQYLLAIGAAHKLVHFPTPCDVTRGSGNHVLRQALRAGMN